MTEEEYLCGMNIVETKFQRGHDHLIVSEGIHNIK